MKLRNFKYTVINANGKQIKGRVEALNRAACIKFLKLKEYQIKSIVEYRNLFSELNKITIGKTFKTKELIFFLKQLGSLLDADVKILQAIELLSLQQEKGVIRKLYFELYQEIYNGISFSEALAKRPKEFPGLLIQMVEIGEISGQLAKTILKIAEHYEKQLKITTEIKGVIRMPIIYLTAALLISVGMIMFVFPNITDLYASFEGAELPGITQFFIDAGDFMSQYSLLVFGGALSVVLVIYLLNKYVEKFHYGATVFFLKTPIFGKLIQMNNQILIAGSLAQMLSNGVGATRALRTIAQFIPNVIYRELILKTIRYVEDGDMLSKSFAESSFIDPIMSKMIATGEKTGDIPKLMANLASYYNGISELRVTQLKNSLQPALLVVVYAIVGVLIIAIMMPMMTLGGQI